MKRTRPYDDGAYANKSAKYDEYDRGAALSVPTDPRIRHRPPPNAPPSPPPPRQYSAESLVNPRYYTDSSLPPERAAPTLDSYDSRASTYSRDHSYATCDGPPPLRYSRGLSHSRSDVYSQRDTYDVPPSSDYWDRERHEATIERDYGESYSHSTEHYSRNRYDPPVERSRSRDTDRYTRSSGHISKRGSLRGGHRTRGTYVKGESGGYRGRGSYRSRNRGRGNYRNGKSYNPALSEQKGSTFTNTKFSSSNGLSDEDIDEEGIEFFELNREPLTEEELMPIQAIRNKNKHLLCTSRRIPCHSFEEVPEAISADTPRLKIDEHRGKRTSKNYWGQRMLLLSEIQFLTRYGSRSDIVLYVGSSPGTHLPFLVSLFKDHEFIFYDPKKMEVSASAFDRSRNGNERAFINQFMFTEDHARYYSDKKPLFVSDIRSIPPSNLYDEEVEEEAIHDLELQKQWHLQMNPVVSMLKFRTPPTKGKVEYLRGKRMYPVWARPSTRETRLIVEGKETEMYDHHEHRQQMKHFNNVIRESYFEHPINCELIPGLCHCFDCTSEVRILKEYVMKVIGLTEEAEILKKVVELSIGMNSACTNGASRSLDVVVTNQRVDKWSGLKTDMKPTLAKMEIWKEKVIREVIREQATKSVPKIEGAIEEPPMYLKEEEGAREGEGEEECLLNVKPEPRSPEPEACNVTTIIDIDCDNQGDSIEMSVKPTGFPIQEQASIIED